MGFHKILSGELPANVLHQDDLCMCFTSIRPAADFHALVVPKKHIEDWRALEADDLELLRHMTSVAEKVSRDHQVTDPRYSFQTPPYNSIYQLHLHIVARPMHVPRTGHQKREFAVMNSTWAVSPDYVEERILRKAGKQGVQLVPASRL